MSDCVVWARPLVGVPDVGAGGTDGTGVGAGAVAVAAVGGVLDTGGDGTETGAGVADEAAIVVIVGLVELGRGAQASSSNPLEATTGAELVFVG